MEQLGYSRLTIEGVAARAKAGKATVYRWWPNKASLVAEALLEEGLPQVPFPETGSVREDFRRQIQLMAQLFAGPKGKEIAMMIGAGQEDSELLDSFRNRLLSHWRSEATQILIRGIRNGELRGEVFSELALDILYGPLFYRLLMGRGGLSPDYVDALCEAVMTGLARR